MEEQAAGAKKSKEMIDCAMLNIYLMNLGLKSL